MMECDGVLVVDKPAGMTSHDVVARLRRILGTRKVGHAGTLDPMATGVLVLGVGRATRLLGFLASSQKEYRATIRLGSATTTDDADGAITDVRDVAGITDAQIRSALANFQGDLEQVPSAVSAIHVEGKRAHERVRAGEEVVLRPRPVHIASITVHGIVPADGGIDVDCTVVCSAGTYIRAIARDLGRVLGVGGHLRSLRRIRSGSFTSMQAMPESIADCAFQSLGQVASATFPTVALSADQASRVGHGIRIPSQAETAEGVHALVDPSGELIALAEVDDAAWRYRAVFVGSA